MKLNFAPARYLMVGAFCAALHNVDMIVLEWAGLHYLFSLFASFFILLATGYVLHVSFTFRQKPSVETFLRFGAAMLANFPAGLALTVLFSGFLALPAYIATPIVTVGMVAFNYLATRWALLRGRRVH